MKGQGRKSVISLFYATCNEKKTDCQYVLICERGTFSDGKYTKGTQGDGVAPRDGASPVYMINAIEQPHRVIYFEELFHLIDYAISDLKRGLLRLQINLFFRRKVLLFASFCRGELNWLMKHQTHYYTHHEDYLNNSPILRCIKRR